MESSEQSGGYFQGKHFRRRHPTVFDAPLINSTVFLSTFAYNRGTAVDAYMLRCCRNAVPEAREFLSEVERYLQPLVS